MEEQLKELDDSLQQAAEETQVSLDWLIQEEAHASNLIVKWGKGKLYYEQGGQGGRGGAGQGDGRSLQQAAEETQVDSAHFMVGYLDKICARH